MENLTNENITLYIAKCYNSPNCIMSELIEDVKHIKYIKRLFRKYKNNDVLNERLILNHIICLSNVFGVEPTVRLLFFRVNKKDYGILKTFLLYLEYMPDIVMGINGKNIHTEEVPVDLVIANVLRRL
jgi:hypothetical protein